MDDPADLKTGTYTMFGTVCGMDQIILELISTATIAIALFGITFCLMQKQYQRVNRSFAAFLFVVALNNLPDAFVRLVDLIPGSTVPAITFAIWLCSALSLAPFLWIYVYTLTSTAQRRPKHIYRHLVLPTAGVLIGLLLVFAPDGVKFVLSTDGTLPTSGWPVFLVISVSVLQLALYPQLAVYLYLIVRRLLNYRRRLRDVYASTEEHELRWIYVIGALGLLFWIAQSLILMIALDPSFLQIPIAVLSIFGLALFAATTLWGLRQRPPLMPAVENVSGTDARVAQEQNQPTETVTGKYGKSALSAEASSRLARKLRGAMEIDHLHRDPNLSLWALARHIGASPNYISQTLNEVLGESFFDFVNRYRVDEAMQLLATTNDTVLTITYDVGFNARSSFYNAFKRVTGQTPTSYRKTMSTRDGTDDPDSELRDT